MPESPEKRTGFLHVCLCVKQILTAGVRGELAEGVLCKFARQLMRSLAAADLAAVAQDPEAPVEALEAEAIRAAFVAGSPPP